MRPWRCKACCLRTCIAKRPILCLGIKTIWLCKLFQIGICWYFFCCIVLVSYNCASNCTEEWGTLHIGERALLVKVTFLPSFIHPFSQHNILSLIPLGIILPLCIQDKSTLPNSTESWCINWSSIFFVTPSGSLHDKNNKCRKSGFHFFIWFRSVKVIGISDVSATDARLQEKWNRRKHY